MISTDRKVGRRAGSSNRRWALLALTGLLAVLVAVSTAQAGQRGGRKVSGTVVAAATDSRPRSVQDGGPTPGAGGGILQ